MMRCSNMKSPSKCSGIFAVHGDAKIRLICYNEEKQKEDGFLTVQQIITQVSNLLSGQVAEGELYAYFNEIELIIQTEYLGISRLDAVQYTVGEGDCEPIVSGQYERMYSYWLLSRGHF